MLALAGGAGKRDYVFERTGWMMDKVVRAGVPLILIAVLAARLIAAPAAVATPAPVQTPAAPPTLDALKTLEPGTWQLDVAGRPSRQLCLADPAALVQIEHEQTGCSRLVVANEARSATVQYTCQGAGWGRSTVRVVTPRQVSISTQGIARNAPFDYEVSARKVGGCSPAGSVSHH